ncbi:glycosyltransferase family 2 protein [Manganibacter manganicus]|uniref:Glycosyltransferase 2-like domain-containing protein n=1 Tax=Manganibacter manganicus TaxID=1873176 RepID=A0A1V8RSP7_9HYPH|nr:glycosyltransferase family A protein [Pseudaminobacter manganicus]OQM76231.1 hypothetical protein BFN67_15155 [Pseudaminobacter manganicus]
MQEQFPIVSVVIPSYNHVTYVEDAIRSACKQELDGFRLEVIVVDDGSTDGSVDLLRQMQKMRKYDFRLVVKGNEGLCRTLNRAIREHSTGQYLAIIASDDMWRADKLRKQFAQLQGNPDCRLCYSNAMTFGEGEICKTWTRRMMAGDVKSILTIFNFIPAGTMMFTRGLFDEVGGFDETGLKLEDWDILLRSSDKTAFCYVDEPLLLYRLHGESSIAKMRARGVLFNEKIKVLRKNRSITNPLLRLVSVCLHFGLDKLARPLMASIKAENK